MSDQNLVIEIRHAAASKATEGNTQSVAKPPPAPPNTLKKAPKPPMHGNPKPDENKAAPEPKPAVAQQPIDPFAKAQRSAIEKLRKARK